MTTVTLTIGIDDRPIWVVADEAGTPLARFGTQRHAEQWAAQWRGRGRVEATEQSISLADLAETPKKGRGK